MARALAMQAGKRCHTAWRCRRCWLVLERSGAGRLAAAALHHSFEGTNIQRQRPQAACPQLAALAAPAPLPLPPPLSPALPTHRNAHHTALYHPAAALEQDSNHASSPDQHTAPTPTPGSPLLRSCTRRTDLMGPYSSNSRRSLRSVTSYDRRDTKSVLKGSPCGEGGRGGGSATG